MTAALRDKLPQHEFYIELIPKAEKDLKRLSSADRAREVEQLRRLEDLFNFTQKWSKM